MMLVKGAMVFILVVALIIAGCSVSVTTAEYACDRDTSEKRKVFYLECMKTKTDWHCKNTAEWIYCKHVMKDQQKEAEE